MLLSLPDELLLHVLDCIIADQRNHAALVPIARTCRRLSALALDWSIWSGPVRIVIPESSVYSTKDLLGILQHDHPPRNNWRTTHLTLAVEEARACTSAAEFLQEILLYQQRALTSIEVHVPSCVHPTLMMQPYVCQESIILRDAHDDHSTSTSTSSHTDILPLAGTSQAMVKTLDIPTCSIHDWIRDGRIFPRLEILTAKVTAEIDSHRFKQTFPSLKHLTIHLTCADDVSMIRPLLTDKRLYPWIESLSVVCKDDLRLRLGQDEIKQVLRSLHGMSRLDIGWDMVVLNSI